MGLVRSWGLALLFVVAGCGGSSGGGIVISVVEGPATLDPLVGAHVRAEGSGGRVVEATTDGMGVVTLEAAGAPWSVTVAAAGHSVVSLLGVTASPSVPIRLESLNPNALALDTFAVSGNLSGSVAAGNSVQIDCNDFDTLSGVAPGPWSSYFYEGDENASSPLHCVALEVDGTGAAVSFAEASVARARMPLTGVDLALPATPPTVQTTHYQITFPASGLTSGCGTINFAQVQRLGGAGERQYIVVGSTAAFLSAGGIDYTMRHFGGEVAPNFAWLNLSCPNGIVNMGLRQFGGEQTFAVGPVDSIRASGSTLADLAVTASATGYDYLVVHIGEDGTNIPRWRVIAPIASGSATATVPALPTGITLAMIGLTDPSTTALGIVVRTGSTPVYGAPASNRSIVQNLVAVGGQYQTITVSGR